MKNLFASSWRIRIYAFIISFVFWAVLLGQKDVVFTKKVTLEYVLSQGHQVKKSPESVTITLTGKRSSLRKFDEKRSLAIDLRTYTKGFKRLDVPHKGLSLPVGVKFLSVEPKSIELYIDDAE